MNPIPTLVLRDEEELDAAIKFLKTLTRDFATDRNELLLFIAASVYLESSPEEGTPNATIGGKLMRFFRTYRAERYKKECEHDEALLQEMLNENKTNPS